MAQPDGNIIKSVPDLDPAETQRLWEQFGALNLQTVIPAAGQGALRGLELMAQGLTPDPLHRAALKTANTLAVIDPQVIREFPLIPIKLIEYHYAMEQGGFMAQKPGSVLLSGSGDRISELYALSDLPLDPVLTGERAQQLLVPLAQTDSGQVNLPPPGGLPGRVHCAEPYPDFTAARIARKYGQRVPGLVHAPMGGLDQIGEGQVLFTDDSHQSLSRNYRPRSVDQLLVMRFDPNSLIPEGRFEITRGNTHVIRDCYEATKTLANLLRLIKPGGNALFSVGTGNDDEETVTRRAILGGFSQCLKVPVIEMTNPTAQLVLPEGPQTDADEESLNTLNRGASIQMLAVGYSLRIQNLVDEMRNPGYEGNGSLWFLRQVNTAVHEVMAKPGFGTHAF